MSRELLSGFPTSDIGYPIKSDRRTTSDKLYITQLLLTEYSINITNRFGGYQYNKQWMYVYGVDIRPNIHLTYTGIRRISDWIFIWCMQGSSGLLTKYSFGVCRGPVDFRLNIQLVCAGIRRIFRLNIHSVYECVRRIANWIFSWCVQGSGRLLIRYSFGVCTSRLPIGYSLIALELNI